MEGEKRDFLAPILIAPRFALPLCKRKEWVWF